MSDFVDTAQVHVKAGNGGAGAVSFRREAHVDRGGPDGGDGGNGGSVWLVADSALASLLVFRDQPFRRAKDGKHGQGKRKRGADGDDLEVAVPVGTVVKSLSGEVLFDLASPGDKVQVARGGRGGFGNSRFANNRFRAPDFAQQGEPGEEFWFDLELKLSADVALVGVPNAGKSSLIRVISNAKPKVGDYPFTTLVPHLGVVRVSGGNEYVVADIPGLIKGAASGKGLGHSFLRHIERSRLIVLLVPFGPSLEEMVDEGRTVLEELTEYRGELSEARKVLVLSKADLYHGDRDKALRQVAGKLAIEPAGWVSSVTGEGVKQLTYELAGRIAAPRESVTQRVLHRPRPRYEASAIKVSPGRFELTGRDALRAVGLSDLSSPQAQLVVKKRLAKMGLIKRLEKLGVSDGDVVVVGDFEFTFEADQ
jgi:GTP-binding protein